ncbi:MAG TPA: ABC transporter ATP-binding protein [Gammaproteobacteria bacterium]|nr:ABC transporter ATP-binding protein [Gammaproteobacteria bacterium]
MNKALSIRGLRKTYHNGVEALKGIDLEVDAGDFFALLGPNGAGKSTTIGVVVSLINKTAGSVKVFGVDIDQDFSRAKSLIAVVPQEFNFNMFEKVEQIILNQAGYYGIPRTQARSRCERFLRQLGLWEKRHDVARELSGGMKRRLMIARALVHQPKLLILDEPTAGVDIELRASMWTFLRQINAEGVTIILTTHYLEEAENLCRNIAIINHGELVEHTNMQQLLHRLQHQTVILDLATPQTALPEVTQWQWVLTDPETLEVEVDRTIGLSPVFSTLEHHHIRVLSMRNKSNRLETLFLGLVGSNVKNNNKEEV